MEVRKQHNINVIAPPPPPLPPEPSLGADPVSTVHLYGPTGQQAPLSHYTRPEGPRNLYGNRAVEQGCWWTENVEKRRNGRR